MKLERIKQSMMRRHQFFLCAALILLSVVTLSSLERASALYILTGATDSAVVLDANTEVPDLSSQIVSINTNVSGRDINLTQGTAVSVSYNGAVVSTQAWNETVSSLLSRLHIAPSAEDMVGVNVTDGQIGVTVSPELTVYDRVTEPTAYETVRVNSAYLPKGTEKTIQAGQNGSQTSVYQVVYSGGKEVSRQCVKASDSTAVNEIVAVGTSVSTVSASDRITKVTKDTDGSGNGTLTFASGVTMRFSTAKAMTATAYTAGSGGADHVTATGTTCHIGTVAVDRRVIPLGTRMYIVTNDGSVVYGTAVAEDTGVRGNIVDLYYNTYSQCISFGRRSCTVYVLS